MSGNGGQQPMVVPPYGERLPLGGGEMQPLPVTTNPPGQNYAPVPPTQAPWSTAAPTIEQVRARIAPERYTVILDGLSKGAENDVIQRYFPEVTDADLQVIRESLVVVGTPTAAVQPAPGGVPNTTPATGGRVNRKKHYPIIAERVRAGVAIPAIAAELGVTEGGVERALAEMQKSQPAMQEVVNAAGPPTAEQIEQYTARMEARVEEIKPPPVQQPASVPTPVQEPRLAQTGSDTKPNELEPLVGRSLYAVQNVVHLAQNTGLSFEEIGAAAALAGLVHAARQA